MGSNAQMREDAERADQVFAELQKEMNGETPNGNEVIETSSVPVEEVEPETKPKETETVESTEQKPADVPVETESDDSLDSKLKAMEEKLEKEEHKNKSNEGRLNARIKELEAKIEAIVNSQPQPQVVADDSETKATESSDEPLVEGLFTEDEREIIGEDVLEAAEKIAEAKIQKALEKQREDLLGVVDTLKSETESMKGSQFRDKLLNSLNLDTASFDRIDTSPAFDRYLQQPDGFSGLTLNDSLGNAIANGDLNSASQIYQAFIQQVNGATARNQVASSAPIPDLASSDAPPRVEVKENYDSYDKVAEAFARGMITRAKKDELMAKIDNQYKLPAMG